MPVSELSRRLSPMDALFFVLDREEEPQNIGMVASFDGAIPFDEFVDTIGRRLHLAPRYRQRVVPTPLHIALPTWEDDSDFDIANHIFEHEVPAPGDEDALRGLAQQLFSGILDHDRPLWEIHLITGLADGRTGMVTRVHHCMVDGVGGVGLLQIIFDVTPEPPDFPVKEFAPREGFSKSARLYDALWDNAIEGLSRLTQFQRSAETYGKDKTLPEVYGAVKEFGNSLKEFLGPLSPMPFNDRFSGERIFSCYESSFAEARALRGSSGGTVNDVVLTVLAGGIRRYAEGHGALGDISEIRVLCPVNIRHAERDGAMGNRITFLPLQIPLGKMSPVERLQRITDTTRRVKAARVPEASAMLLGMVGSMAPLAQRTLLLTSAKRGVQDFLGKKGLLPPANVICTNVPGPQIPLYTVGRRLLGYYPLQPLTMEMGLSCGVTSYDQRLFFTLMADGNCLPDVDVMMNCFEASYDELRAAAKVGPGDYVVIGARKNGNDAARPGALPKKAKTKKAKTKRPRPKKAATKKG